MGWNILTYFIQKAGWKFTKSSVGKIFSLYFSQNVELTKNIQYVSQKKPFLSQLTLARKTNFKDKKVARQEKICYEERAHCFFTKFWLLVSKTMYYLLCDDKNCRKNICLFKSFILKNNCYLLKSSFALQYSPSPSRCNFWPLSSRPDANHLPNAHGCDFCNVHCPLKPRDCPWGYGILILRSSSQV